MTLLPLTEFTEDSVYQETVKALTECFSVIYDYSKCWWHGNLPRPQQPHGVECSSYLG